MVAQEIDLEEKRVYTPTPMIHEPFFSLPAVAAPTIQDTVVPALVVILPVETMNDDEELVLQDPIDPIATHEGEQQTIASNRRCAKCGGPYKVSKS